ncbi:MAG: hypothetical protein ACFCUV_24720 [Rivularia sp. (in: cyanobacteria)]
MILDMEVEKGGFLVNCCGFRSIDSLVMRDVAIASFVAMTVLRFYLHVPLRFKEYSN